MHRKHRNHFNLLCNIGDLVNLVVERSDIRSFLKKTVEMVSRHLEANVCSIYLYEEASRELVLRATRGLNPEAVDVIRMRPGEGLVGQTFATQSSVCEGCASCNPAFKYFEEADEDRFESFLSVPIVRGVQKIGVLVVQHERRNAFNETDAMALRATASQLAGALENARLLMDLGAAGLRPPWSDTPTERQFVKGESASGGVAFAEAVIRRRSHGALLYTTATPPGEYTLSDFRGAVKAASDQLKALQARLTEKLPESAALIFSAHFMILKDPQFIERIETLITEGTPPARAIHEVAYHYIDVFSASSHAYIREKVNDIEDLAGRILKNLMGRPSGDREGMTEGAIVVARNLYPSEMLKFASEEVKGIILVRGGVTSHVAILARSMGIPMVIADRPDLMEIPDGTPVLLDADIGNIYVRPGGEIIKKFEAQRKVVTASAPLAAAMSPTTHTRDGVRIHLLANINLLSELAAARDLKAEGIGLYRTEFPFLIRSSFPSEAEQYLIYRRLFDEMTDRIVTIRTLDVGGDKVLAYANATADENPELGLRSIRFSLRHRDLFEGQVRAILRAASDAREVRILFPMISSIDEYREAVSVVEACKASLKRDHLPFHPAPALGIMVELPAVLGTLTAFAREVDFFSIGTNDFIQYMLAADRSNEKVADYYRPHHPAVLRGLAAVVRAADEEGIPVSICGEMAHEQQYLPFLLGIGIRAVSVDPKFLPMVQTHIAATRLSDAEALAEALLAASTLASTRTLLETFGKPGD
jgi:phosphotransferase system enzyme I (PtsP)